jgi:hypothetical protein
MLAMAFVHPATAFDSAKYKHLAGTCSSNAVALYKIPVNLLLDKPSIRRTDHDH